MNQLDRLLKTLENPEGKYLLAYRTKHNKEIQKGLPIFKTKSEAESKVADLVKDIDVIIECWVEVI